MQASSNQLEPGHKPGSATTQALGQTSKRVAVRAVSSPAKTSMKLVGAPGGTMTLTMRSERIEKTAEIPAILTEVRPPRFTPRRVTRVPMGPSGGPKLRISGRVCTMNAVPLEAVPVGVATVMVALVAPAGTVVRSQAVAEDGEGRGEGAEGHRGGAGEVAAAHHHSGAGRAGGRREAEELRS